MSETLLPADNPSTPALSYKEVSRLCREAALRVREGRRSEDIADALPAIRRASDALAAYYDLPFPVHFASFVPSEANAPLFAALAGDYPGEDWQTVCAVAAGDPDQDRHHPYYLWAEAASGRTECLLYAAARRGLAVCLSRWARYFAARQLEQEEANEKARAITAKLLAILAAEKQTATEAEGDGIGVEPAQGQEANKAEGEDGSSDPTEVEQTENLGDKERELLVAYLKLNAVSRRQRVTRLRAARKADPGCPPASYNRANASLVKREYLAVASKAENGGCWLTATGKAMAESFTRPRGKQD